MTSLTKFFLSKTGLFIILLCIGLLVYQNSLYGNFIWDDQPQVLDNAYIRSLKNIPTFFTGSTFYLSDSRKLEGVYYRPLMTTLYAGIYQAFGLNPFFFHLIQLLIHIVNTYLLWLVLQKLLNRPRHKLPLFHQVIVCMMSVIFLIHPVNSEVVSYIANLQDTLFFFFGISALLIILTIKQTRRAILIAQILLFLSLLGKETGIVFFGILFSYLYLFKRKFALFYSLLSVVTITLYIAMRCGIAKLCIAGGKPNPIANLPFLSFLMQIPAIIFYYLKTFFFPLPLAIGQDWVVSKPTFSEFYGPFIASALFFLMITGYLFYLFIKDDPFRYVYSFFASWFFIGLLFQLHVIPLSFTVADRWLYVPMAGVLGMIAVFLRTISHKKTFMIVTSCLVIVIGLFSLRTYRRNNDWKDNYTLFSHDITQTKNSIRLENNLGVELYKRKRYTEALVRFKNALRLAPDWHTARVNLETVERRQKILKIKL